MLHGHSRAALAALPLILALAAPAVAGTIVVTHHGLSSAATCTLAQAIDAANRANNGAGSYGATPAGATTVDPLRYSVTREIGSGSCSGATAGPNTISLQNFAGQELLFDPAAGLYPDQGWNNAVRDRADNYWYGPNALPPVASEIRIDGALVTLRIPDNARRLRFFFVGADPSANNLNYFFEPVTPGYNTPGAGKLTLRQLTLRGGRQRGGQALDVGGGAGLGGAIFNQGKLVLQSVTLHENSAIGGQYPGGYDADAAPGGIGGGDPGPTGPTRRAGGMGGPVPGGTRDVGHAGNDSSCLDCAGGKDNGLGGDAYALLGGGEFGGRSGNGGGGGHWSTEATAYSSGGGGGGGFGGGPGGTPSQVGDVPGSFGLGGGGNCIGGGIGAAGSPACGGTVAAGGGFGGGGGFAFGDTSRGGFGGGSGLVAVGNGTPGFGGGGSNGNAASGGGGAGLGGAVFNHFGNVDIYNSTLARNQALGSTNSNGYFGGRGLGGAVFNLNGTLSIRYSTLAENRVAGENADGGAIYSLGYNADDSALTDPAFTGSHVALIRLDGAVLADSLWVRPNGDIDANDIVIDRPAQVANGAANQAASLLQNLTNQTQNLVERKLAVNGGVIEPNSWLAADPQLGPLADNGGRLLTKAPAAGSPVIDGQIRSLCTGVTNDQRGVQRPIGAACDLGAVEDEGTLLVTSSGNSDATDGQCTLREAIDNANAASQPRSDCATGNAVRNRVRFASNVSTITLDGSTIEIYSFPTDVNGDRDSDGLPDVTIDAASSSRHFVLNNGSVVSLRGLRLINGRHSGSYGGSIAIHNGRLSLSDCIIEDSYSVDGGAIATLAGTQLELRHCLLRNNIAAGRGGAIAGAGTLVLETSSFVGNSAAFGGALWIYGTTSLVNSTLHANSAVNGGAIRVDEGANATLQHVTVAGNQAQVGGGLQILGSLSLARSIVAGNSGSNCSGSATDAGNNLAWGDASCGPTVALADPRLLPLADYGGGTPTLMPDTGSAAIDRIDCVAAFATDQRGVTRPQGLRCDPGAVESTPFADRIFAAGFE